MIRMALIKKQIKSKLKQKQMILSTELFLIPSNALSYTVARAVSFRAYVATFFIPFEQMREMTSMLTAPALQENILDFLIAAEAHVADLLG